MSDNQSNLVGDLVAGALGGLVGGPVGVGIGIAGVLATELLPSLGKYLFGASGASVGAAVAQVVQAVTGTNDPVAQVQAARDPVVASTIRIRLAEIEAAAAAAERQAQVDTFAAQIKDTQGARDQTVALAKAGSLLAWGSAVVSFTILGSFLVMEVLVMFFPIPPGSEQVVIGFTEILKVLTAAVVGYWVGSSASSNKKTDLLYTKPTP